MLLKKNTAYTFYLTLADSASPSSFKVNPTIAAGDFKISKDGGALVNLATLPVVEPAGSVMVKISLSATEMDADKVNVVGIDVAGAEWNDVAKIFDVQSDLDNLADAVWDEMLTGLTHNIQNSAGKRLRDIASQAIHTDTAQGPAANGNQIQLALSASTVDGSYDPSMITITDGTGAGQTRLIYQYEGSTRIATVDRDWKVIPDDTSEYIIFSHPGREHVNEGLAQGGTINTITLNTLASSIDNVYNYQTVFLRSGLGEDQTGLIVAYDGTTKVATIDGEWDVIPDDTTGYAMLPTFNNPTTENFSSMQGHVTIDTVNGTAGTVYPQGTDFQPVNNLADAKVIAAKFGFTTFVVIGIFVVGASDDIDGLTFLGDNPLNSVVVLTSGCSTVRSNFTDMIVTGVINGPVYMGKVALQDISGIGSDAFPSLFFECIFRPGTLTLKSGLSTPQNIHFVNCITAVSGNGASIFDFNGSTSSVSFRRYGGGIQIINYTGGQDSTFEFDQGKLIIAASCTDGRIELGGIYKLDDSGALTIEERNGSIACAVLDDLSDDHLVDGSIGKIFDELYKLQGMKLGKPMTVTRTSRVVDDVTLELTGDGQVTTTVTRQ